MPGMNTSGEPRLTDYNLGRGKVYFSPLVANRPTQWRDLGNAPEVVITIETEKLEHRSSREGLKLVDLEVVVSQKVTLRVVLDELNFENLAEFFSGQAAQVANDGGAPRATVLVTTAQGRWYDLYSPATGMPDEDTQGARIYDIGDVTIEHAVSGSLLVEDVDYRVDHDLGRIFVIEGGGMVAGPYDVTIDENLEASAVVQRVNALQQSSIVGALKFVGVNPADADNFIEYNFHQVRLSAEGDLPLITDEWATVTLIGTAERNPVADPVSPTMTIVTNPNQ